MLPNKKPRLDMVEKLKDWQDNLIAELEIMKGEVETVDVKKSHHHRTESVTYRPTYRAVLAKHGYLVRHTLGSGSYSKVKMVYCVGKSKEKAAVKIIDRHKAPKDFQSKFLPREIEIWPRLQHPNITRVSEVFEDSRRVYLVLDYAENGDVLRYIQQAGAVNESLARTWFNQLGDAVRYLHDQNITHRDLKLENLLLDSGYAIKLCDFGFVKPECFGDLSSTYCGSKSYAAPEILQGEPYDPKRSDIWAMGVILYIFVTGKMPYDESKGNTGVLEEQKKLHFPWHKLKKISEECKQLILWLFQFEYSERPDIHAVLSSNWARRESPILPQTCPTTGSYTQEAFKIAQK